MAGPKVCPEAHFSSPQLTGLISAKPLSMRAMFFKYPFILILLSYNGILIIKPEVGAMVKSAT